MKTSILCELLLRDACDDNVSFYRTMFETQSLDEVKDEHWRAFIALARSLSAEQRETLLAFARQSAVDAISTICGGIDGTTQLGGQLLALSLIDDDGQQHAGELQDQFLAIANDTTA
jgi:hypothetical protein